MPRECVCARLSNASTVLFAAALAAPCTDYIAFCSTTPDTGVLAVSLLVRMPEKPCSTTRIREVVGPDGTGPGLSYLYLGFVHLRQGERRGFDFGPLDTVAVVMSGSVEAEWEDADGQMRRHAVEGRLDVFDGLPWAICAGPFTTLHLEGVSAAAELALVRAELIDEDAAPGFVRPPEPGATIVSSHGPRVIGGRSEGPSRQVRRIAGVERSAGHEGSESRRLVVGETLIPAGAGCDAALCEDDDIISGEHPADLASEGVLHYRFRPGQGAAIQGICSPSRKCDHTYQVQHGDTIAVRSGLRPKDPTCDCDLYILWARAGVGVANTRTGGCLS